MVGNSYIWQRLDACALPHRSCTSAVCRVMAGGIGFVLGSVPGGMKPVVVHLRGMAVGVGCGAGWGREDGAGGEELGKLQQPLGRGCERPHLPH